MFPLWIHKKNIKHNGNIRVSAVFGQKLISDWEDIDSCEFIKIKEM